MRVAPDLAWGVVLACLVIGRLVVVVAVVEAVVVVWRLGRRLTSPTVTTCRPAVLVWVWVWMRLGPSGRRQGGPLPPGVAPSGLRA